MTKWTQNTTKSGLRYDHFEKCMTRAIAFMTDLSTETRKASST